MADRTVLVRLRANIAEFRSQMDQAAKAAETVGKKSQQSTQEASTALGRLTESAQKNEKAWSTAGTALAGFGAVTAVALGATIKAAIDWESAWAGVTKTVSGTPQQLQGVEDGLRGLARTLPATHGEIAAVAEAAGQLGVQTGSIVAFTKTMVDLGETTNLSADEAATSLAQLMNVMQTAPDDVGRLGASLVALGNAGASTEADIVNMASYLTGSAKLIGASESDVLALSNAMTSMGINAERGGGVMTRVMQDVYEATQTGGAELEAFADVAGMSGEEFARAFEADPIRAIDSFIQGLNDVEASGGNVVKTLNDLGYKGTQDTAVLLQMKGAGDLLTESLDLGSEAWKENTALVEEAAKRYDTTASQLEIARNGINDAAIEIGEVFLPILADLAGSVADLAGWFADLPDPIQATIGGLAGVAGVASLAGGAFLLLFPRVVDTVQAFKTLKTDMPGVASGMGSMAKAAGAAAAIGILGAAVAALDAALAPTPAGMEQVTATLLDMGDGVASLDAKARELGKNTTTEIDGFGDAIKRVTDPSNMERLNDFGGALFNVVSLGSAGTGEGAASRRRTLEFLSGLDQSLSLMVSSGNADLAAEKFRVMAEEAKRNGVSVGELKALFPEYADALKGVENEQKLAGEGAAGLASAVGSIAPTIEATYSSLEGYAAALGMDEEATKALIEKSSELGQTLGEFINPLGVYTGLLDEKKAAEEEAARKAAEAAGASAESWRDFVTDTGFSFDEYMRRLDEQVSAQTNWQSNMLILAGRVSQGTLEELAKMGPEGAPLVADLVNRSDAELDRFDEITALRSKEATDAWGAQLTLAAPVLAAVGRKAGSGVVAELVAQLQAGTITIGEIASRFGIVMADGINPILTSLGKPRIVGNGPNKATFADGGWTGPGGKYTPAGIVHGNEYVEPSESVNYYGTGIFEALHKRAIPRETLTQLTGYANGGFVSVAGVPKPSSTAPYQPPLSTVGDATMQKAYDEVTAWLAANLEPPAASGGSSTGLLPIMAAARAYTQATYGINNIGGFANRNIAGTNVKSDHAMGKAIDVMTSNLGLGWKVANDFAFGDAHSKFRAENVIWQQSISSNGGPFKRMADRGSATQNHYDHVHIDTYDTGGVLPPGFSVAANFTGANEHKAVYTTEQWGAIQDMANWARGASSSAPAQFVGDLYLDSGEFLGKVRGEAAQVVSGALTGMGQAARFGVRT